MSKKMALVPRLRFQEFQNTKEWVEKPLGDVTYTASRKNSEERKYPIYSINNKEGFLPQTDQFEGVDSNLRGYDISLYKIVDKNTFAYNPARINIGSIGYSGELSDIIISSLYVCFKTTEEVEDKFFQFFLETSTFTRQVENHTEGGIRSYLFYENFSKILCQFPQKEEQQKIADCLSSLDDLIAAEDKKLAILKLHKKGLMQKLFTQEISFKDSNNKEFPKWHKKNINDICMPKGIVRGPFGGALKKEYFVSSGYKVYEQRNAIYQDLSIGNYYIDSERYNAMKRFSISKNDFIVSCSGTIGKIYKIPNKFESGVINQALLKLTINCEMCNYDYFYQHFTWSEFQHTIIDSTQGGAMQNMIGMDLFKQTNMQIPSLPEQQKIADCLSSVDKLISLQAEKIEALKLHKKGLIQGLFPSIEEADA